jgi:hypothetical protein
MHDVTFPVEKTSGVPVVITPEEIDITDAGGLRGALLRAAAQGRKTLRGGHDPDSLLRLRRAPRAAPRS